MLAVSLDGRNIEASPGGFLHALGDGLGLGDGESALERLKHEAAVVLTIDSYDSLTPLDPWLRETFLPQLPARGVVAIAGRKPPPVDWTSDPALGPIFRRFPCATFAERRAGRCYRSEACRRSSMPRCCSSPTDIRSRSSWWLMSSRTQEPGRCSPGERPERRPRTARPAHRHGADRRAPEGARDIRASAGDDRSAARRRHRRRRSARAVRMAAWALVCRAQRRGAPSARPGARGARRRLPMAESRRLAGTASAGLAASSSEASDHHRPRAAAGVLRQVVPPQGQRDGRAISRLHDARVRLRPAGGRARSCVHH